MSRVMDVLVTVDPAFAWRPTRRFIWLVWDRCCTDRCCTATV